MIRDYKDGTNENVNFFIGTEVEKTPAYGKKTLFVVGLQNPEKIKTFYHAHSCEHIFFGANHSYNPSKNGNWETWEAMIKYFLGEDYVCSLDIPTDEVEFFHDSGLCEYDTFIPQIRISIPYVTLWNYNAMVKIDDKDFRATNPGVWCHSLHDLMDRSKFTDWSRYRLDDIIE
jgi:hypothetical protein